MKKEKRMLILDQYEYGVMVNALNLMRNNLIGKQWPTDPVDNLLVKTIDAPTVKRKRKGDNETR